MQQLVNYAEKQKQKLQNAFDKGTAILKQAPKGLLRISKKNNRYYYYKTDGINNKKRKYVPKKEMEIAKKLAERDYLQNLLPLVKKNIAVINTFLKNFNPHELENCFVQLSPARKPLINPIFINTETYINQWQLQKYEHKQDAPNGSLLTMNNEPVRSKSEKIIADCLKSKNIPYHYEYPVHISNGQTIYPDFLCLNKRTRQEFYWEHCGQMDDPVYTIRMTRRLAEYSKKEIITGKNLILTFETKQIQLSTKEIERIIETFLL